MSKKRARRFHLKPLCCAGPLLQLPWWVVPVRWTDFRAERLVIPHALRFQTMKQLHSSHVGINGCLRRAHEYLFWPRMSAEIKKYITQCEICSQYSAKQAKETQMCHEPTDRPREKVAVDIWNLDNKDYLITVDYFSNFWEIDRLRDTKASICVRKLKSHFARNCIPAVVISDNRPQFTSSEFAQFRREWSFEQRTSNPGNQQANGQAESTIKTAKSILRKAKKCNTYLAILAARNTPTEYMDSSPAQRLLGRRTKTQLPITAELLKSQHVNTENFNKRIKTRQQEQVHYYNRKARDLPPLQEGDVVCMRSFTLNKKTWGKATVAKRLDERSYLVTTEDASYRRNRVHLRKTKEMGQPDTCSIKSCEVDTGKGCQAPQPIGQPISTSPTNNQKSCLHKRQLHHPRSEKPKQGCPNKPVSPTSMSVPTETRPRRAVREPAYLKDYIRNWTVNPRSTHWEQETDTENNITTWLETICLFFFFP